MNGCEIKMVAKEIRRALPAPCWLIASIPRPALENHDWSGITMAALVA
jgi:hypothetical protein